MPVAMRVAKIKCLKLVTDASVNRRQRVHHHKTEFLVLISLCGIDESVRLEEYNWLLL